MVTSRMLGLGFGRDLIDRERVGVRTADDITKRLSITIELIINMSQVLIINMSQHIDNPPSLS